MARSNYRLPKIPEMTIRRLSVYTRCLLQLEEDGVKTISSQELAERFNLNSAQVRKDLAYFGEFGVRGIGYYVSGLKAELQRILGLDREWAVALVGFGNLGSALFHYKGFGRQGFRIAVDLRRRPGARSAARSTRCRSCRAATWPARSRRAASRSRSSRCRRRPRRRSTDQLVAAGIKAVLNFAPDPPARAARRPSQERRPLDRARDALLLSGQGLAVAAPALGRGRGGGREGSRRLRGTRPLPRGGWAPSGRSLLSPPGGNGSVRPLPTSAPPAAPQPEP